MAFRRFRRFKRVFKRRQPVKRLYRRMVRKSVRQDFSSKPEVKREDVLFGTATIGAPSNDGNFHAMQIDQIGQGAAINQRIGNKIRVLGVRGIFRVLRTGTGTSDNILRFLVVQWGDDAPPNAPDIFDIEPGGSQTYQSMLNSVNLASGKLIVLKDMSIPIGQWANTATQAVSTGTIITRSVRFSIGLKKLVPIIHFNGAAGNSTEKNNIYVVTWSANDTSTANSFSGITRVSFTDV